MKNTLEQFDVIIAGCGPGGMTVAHQLSGHGLKTGILEKERFPRDKICGDALSTDVVNQLLKIDPELLENLSKTVQHLDPRGVRIVAPNHSQMDTNYSNPNFPEAAGFLVKRMEFDHFFYKKIQQLQDVRIFENQRVKEITYVEEGIRVSTSDGNEYQAKILVGADGANSIVKNLIGKPKDDKYHYCMGLRQYYENVSGFHPGNFIELHFYKELLPGYFWIFPLTDNQANVGIGMLAHTIREKKINLQEKMQELITTHPNLKERFTDARPLEKMQGLRLPLASKKRAISGDRFLLVGDAASLIDPFTGEGVASAIRSGRLAAQHIKKATEKKCFDAAFNKNYDKNLYATMWNEFKISGILQRVLKYPKLINLVVGKAHRNPSFLALLEAMLDKKDPKKELLKPGFIFKLFS